jgi:predicted glycosyltransferase
MTKFMKYLFDIGHPAHVHYFKNLIRILEKNGHQIAITTRDKEISLSLLDSYRFQYTCTGKNLTSKIGKLYSILRNDLAIFRVAKIFKPDLFISFFSPFAAHVGKLIGKPVIGFNDTENATISIMFAKPFTDIIIVPNCYKGKLPINKKITFSGYLELSYLHPHRFVPDPSVLDLLGIGENEKYVILRFVSWSAGHDLGHFGISLDMKRTAVKEFSKYAKVFISSEKKLPDDLMKYQISIPPEMMHSALFYAMLLYGESATMASEGAVLGTPAIYVDNEGRGYTDEEEKKYGLVFNFTESKEDQELSIIKGVELLKTLDIKRIWQGKRKKMLSEKIDVTAFMVWLIENYPESAITMKQNPDYQYRFGFTT